MAHPFVIPEDLNLCIQIYLVDLSSRQGPVVQSPIELILD